MVDGTYSTLLSDFLSSYLLILASRLCLFVLFCFINKVVECAHWEKIVTLLPSADQEPLGWVVERRITSFLSHLLTACINEKTADFNFISMLLSFVSPVVITILITVSYFQLNKKINLATSQKFLSLV